MPMKTGVIGLGAMGAGMAANLHRAGYLTSAWNRTPERGRLFAEDHDVSLAPNPAALAEACDLIITCVSADRDLFQTEKPLV